MTDDMLKENQTLSDSQENQYRAKTRQEEVEAIDCHRKEALQNQFINTSHVSCKPDNIEEPFKEVLQSHQQNEFLSEAKIANASLREGDISETSKELENNVRDERPKRNQSEQSGKHPSLNGCLTMEQKAFNVVARVSRQTSKEERHSSCKSVSDEDSLSRISESFSSELNTNGIGADSKHRKDDACISSTRREEAIGTNSLARGTGSEKEQSKKKISFRALVRMKGLGRKLRKKHQGKSKQKHINNKTDSGNNRDLFFSDSSAKYLLESSTSVTDEQSAHKRALKDDEPDSSDKKKKSYSFSGSATTDCIFQSSESSSSEQLSCTSAEYLQKRRSAVCEELERTITCNGEQTLAELRSILVIQHKLTGFGLL